MRKTVLMDIQSYVKLRDEVIRKDSLVSEMLDSDAEESLNAASREI